MAIAFARMNIHTRSKGHSAVRGAAYRAGSKLYDERTGETHDYTNRHDVTFHRIILPSGVDKKFEHQETFWNELEKCEKRKDSQLAKDLQLALPRELDEAQRIALVMNFVYENFTVHHIPVDVSIHNDDDGNPHGHLFFPTRRIYGDKFSTHKARDLNPVFKNSKSGKGFISETERLGEEWRFAQNKFAKDNDLDFVVDANHVTPQKHEGRIRGEEEHYLRATNLLQKQATIELGLDNPNTIINHLSATFSVFSERDVQRLVFKTLTGLEEGSDGEQGSGGNHTHIFQNLMAKILQNPQILALGPGEDGRDRYTTRGNYQKESRMEEQAIALRSERQYQYHSVNPKALKQALINHGLNEEQVAAVKHITGSEGVACVVGRAGTGKTSYVLNAARAAWEESGYRVLGTAFSGTAAKGLEHSSGIKSRTLDALHSSILKGYTTLGENDIVVMDEAGMTDLSHMTNLMNAVYEARAKLVLVGDPAQLQPVGPGAPFRALLSAIGFSELVDIRRQATAGDRQASIDFAQGNIIKALNYYDDEDRVFLHKNSTVSQNALIKDWFAGFNKDKPNVQLILSFQNKDIKQLNALARQTLKQNKAIGTEEHRVSSHYIDSLVLGDRLLFLKNQPKLGVCNGDFATVQTIHDQIIEAKLDNGDIVTFNPKDYKHFTYGYAATVHKSQGATFDNIYVHASGYGWDRFLTYVAMTRHKLSVKLYADEESYADKDTLKTALSRMVFRDSVLDFPLSYAIRRGFSPEGAIGRLIDKVSNSNARIRYRWKWVTNYHAYLQEKSKRNTLNLSKQRRNQAKRVANLADVRRGLGKDWHEFHESLPTGVKAFAQPEYRALYARNLERNRLAHDIHLQVANYVTALEQNNISLSDLAQWAKSHEQAETVQRYIRNYQAGRTVHQQTTAAKLYPQLKETYSLLSYYAEEHKLPIKEITQQLKLNYEAYESRKLLRVLSGQERADFLLGQRFVKLDRQIKHANQLLFKYEAFEGLSDEQQGQRQALSAECNRLGATIHEHKSRFQTVINLYDIKEDVLDKAQGKHETREKVKNFYQSKGIGLDYWAGFMKHDLGSYFPYIHEFDIDTKAIHFANFRHQRRMKTHELKPDDKQRLKLLAHYVELSRQTGKAYAKAHAVNQTTNEVDAKLKKFQVAEQYASRRNALAYQISTELDAFEPLKEFYKFDCKKIDAQALQHKRLAFVKSYVSKTKQTHRAQMSAYMKLNLRDYYQAMKVANVDMKRFREDVYYHHYTQTLNELSPDQHRAYHLLLAYEEHRKAAGKAWYQYKQAETTFNALFEGGTNATYNFPPKEQQQLSKLLQEMDRLTDKQNEVAYQLLHELYLKHDNTLLTFFDVSHERLNKAANAHAAKLLITRYLSAQTSLEKNELASLILANKASYRYIYQRPELLQWKVLQQQKEKYEHQLQLGSLSKEERAHYQLVQRYNQARINAATAWSKLFEDQEKQVVPHVSQKMVCYTLNRVRNELAYRIALAPEHYAPYLKHTRIKLVDIKKHALSYQQRLERQEKPHLKLKASVSPSSTPIPIATVAGEPIFSSETVDDALIQMGAEFYETILGASGKKSGNALRYGSKGSLSVTVRGSKAGTWYSFETAKGGSPLSLLMDADYGWGLSYPEAIKEGARMAGLSELDASYIKRPKKSKMALQQEDKEEQASLQKKIASARYYYLSAKSIQGTLGEKYLREVRGIRGDINEFRYHPNIRDSRSITTEAGETHWETTYHPGIVVAARNQEGDITATQTILLNKNTAQKADKNQVQVVKRTRGKVKGSAVLIHKGTSNTVMIAEGPETAASLIKARPDANIYVTLGNIRNAESLSWLATRHKTKEFYFAADKDDNTNNLKALKLVAKALKEEHGIASHIALPQVDGQTKCDFNDVLKLSGTDEVKRQLSHFKLITVKENLPLVKKETLTTKLDTELKDVLKKTKVTNADKPLAHKDTLHAEFSELLQRHNKEWEALAKLNDKEGNWVIKFRALAIEKTDYSAIIKAESSALSHLQTFASRSAMGAFTKDAPLLSSWVRTNLTKAPKVKRELAIDWLSPNYQSEWNNLKQFKNPFARWMINYYELAKTKTDPKDIEKTKYSITKEAQKIASSKAAMQAFKRFAPKLGAHMEQSELSKTRQKGRDIDE